MRESGWGLIGGLLEQVVHCVQAVGGPLMGGSPMSPVDLKK